MTKLLLSGDPHCAACGDSKYVSIDRIASNGDIREHLTEREGSREKALCGIDLKVTQSPAGNRECRRCQQASTRHN